MTNTQGAVSTSARMVKVRLANNIREVYEVPSTMLAHKVDGLYYKEFKVVRYIGELGWSPIGIFGRYQFVELDLGFDDKPARTIVCISPVQ